MDVICVPARWLSALRTAELASPAPLRAGELAAVRHLSELLCSMDWGSSRGRPAPLRAALFDGRPAFEDLRPPRRYPPPRRVGSGMSDIAEMSRLQRRGARRTERLLVVRIRRTCPCPPRDAGTEPASSDLAPVCCFSDQSVFVRHDLPATCSDLLDRPVRRPVSGPAGNIRSK